MGLLGPTVNIIETIEIPEVFALSLLGEGKVLNPTTCPRFGKGSRDVFSYDNSLVYTHRWNIN